MGYAVVSKGKCYVYYEVIRQLGSGSVLDIGTFQAQAGTISRQLLDARISSDIIFDAVRSPRLRLLPIYEVIYDNILEPGDILSKHYDTAVFIGGGKLFGKSAKSRIIDWAKSNTLSFLTDTDEYAAVFTKNSFNEQKINYDGNDYFLYIRK